LLSGFREFLQSIGYREDGETEATAEVLFEQSPYGAPALAPPNAHQGAIHHEQRLFASCSHKITIKFWNIVPQA
jgi:hypothetical protein